MVLYCRGIMVIIIGELHGNYDRGIICNYYSLLGSWMGGSPEQ